MEGRLLQALTDVVVEAESKVLASINAPWDSLHQLLAWAVLPHPSFSLENLHVTFLQSPNDFIFFNPRVHSST